MRTVKQYTDLTSNNYLTEHLMVCKQPSIPRFKNLS
jgi:hypothetical protein